MEKKISCFPTKTSKNIEQNKLKEAQPMSHIWESDHAYSDG